MIPLVIEGKNQKTNMSVYDIPLRTLIRLEEEEYDIPLFPPNSHCVVIRSVLSVDCNVDNDTLSWIVPGMPTFWPF